jgi:hypothetical protein
MSVFPGTNTVVLMNASSGDEPAQNQDFKIINAPSGLTFDFQSTNQNGHNVEFLALNGSQDQLNVIYGDLFNENSTGSFFSGNFDNVSIDTETSSNSTFYTARVDVEAPLGDNVTLTFDNHSSVLIAGTDVHTTLNPLDPNSASPPDNPVGTDSLHLQGGTGNNPTTGTLKFIGNGDVTIGVTNASEIDSTGGGPLHMNGPDNVITYGSFGTFTGVTVDVAAGGSELQGSMGFLTFLGGPGNIINNKELYGGNVGNDTITDTGGSTEFWGDGGKDSITVGGGHNTVTFGAINVGGIERGQIITNNADFAFTGFWGVTNNANGLPNSNAIGASTSDDINTIKGFDVTTDQLDFNAFAWAGNTGVLTLGGSGTLVHADGTRDVVGNAAFESVTSHGQTLANGTDFVLYGIDSGALANAAALATALETANVGDINLGVLGQQHMLFAYISTGNELKIADVDFFNGTNSGNTAGQTIFASDIANLGAGVTLLGLGTNAQSIHFDQIG